MIGPRLAGPLYEIGVSLAVWGVLGPLELAKIALGRSHPARLRERLGAAAPRPGPARERFLVHAVSVGEMAAAGALISALHRESDGASFILTTGNLSGYVAGGRLQARIPAIEAVVFLPWDRRAALERWLRSFAPDAVVVVETEIWPNLFRACRALGVPLFVVNGRLYPGDVARYRLARGFFAEVLGAATWIGVTDAAEHDSFLRIGAPADRTEVAGNLKFDVDAADADLAGPWRAALQAPTHHPLVVAGSTHHPEERLLLDTLLRLRPRFPAFRLALAPRHPRRCARVTALATARGLSAVLWSQTARAGPRWDVLVLDELGALAGLFRHADVAFIGGSLAGRGGHNPLEAAACARAIVMGPSIGSFCDIVSGLSEAGGVLLLEDRGDPSGQLEAALAGLLADAGRRDAMGRSALAFLDARRGVARRYARTIMNLLAPAPRVDGPPAARDAAQQPRVRSRR